MRRERIIIASKIDGVWYEMSKFNEELQGYEVTANGKKDGLFKWDEDKQKYIVCYWDGEKYIPLN